MTKDEIDKAATFAASRAKLMSLAYRMLGSRAEAEDVVQDAWLKWHLTDAGTVRTPAAWLATITVRLAIDRLRHLRMERQSRATGWLPEPWLDGIAPSAEDEALRASAMSYGLLLLLERLTPDERAGQALETLSRLVQRPLAFLRRELVSFHLHSWNSDPFSRGAYSYPVVGGEAALRKLASLGGPLFFAGEAFAAGAARGTVHGAIASGLRSARKVSRFLGEGRAKSAA